MSDGTKWALLVGINAYERADMTPLAFAVNDARVLAATLITTCGFPPDHIFMLTSDDVEKPTRNNVVFRLEYLTRQVKPNDTFLFFFAGHGIYNEREDTSYLLTYEADPRSERTLQTTGLPAKDVQEWLNEIPARTVLAIYDACRNEPLRARGVADNPLTRGLARDVRVARQRTAEAEIEASATFYACKEGQRSYEWETQQHGFFTYFLVEGLKGSAADEDGKVTLNSLESYLARAVPQATLREKNVEQEPWVERVGAGAGEVSLAFHEPPKSSPVIASPLEHRAFGRRREVVVGVFTFAVIALMLPLLWMVRNREKPLAERKVCAQTGKLLTQLCPTSKMQKFPQGQEPTGQCPTHVVKTLQGHEGGVKAVAFSRNGEMVASGGADATVRLWSVQTGELKRTLTGHTEESLSLAFSPDGADLASGSRDGEVRVWNTHTGKLRQAWGPEPGAVRSLAFSPDGDILAVGIGRRGKPGVIRLRDAPMAGLKREVLGHNDAVTSVAFSSDGRSVVSGSEDSTVKFWDAQTGEEKHFREGVIINHSGAVWSVAFSHDGQTLASGSNDGTLKLWDAQTGVLQRMPPRGSGGDVFSVAFSPDGKIVASGSRDGKVRLWDTQTEAQRTLTGHKNAVMSVAFSPDGNTIASGGEDDTVKLWRVK